MEMEVIMISHILAPLDGSTLAECVLPHVSAISAAEKAAVTLLHVLETSAGEPHGIDMLEWHLRKREAEAYLESIASRFDREGITVKRVILEGPPAETVIDFAHNNGVDLVAVSTHGRSGLSGWNVSSVVQKIILRSHTSTLLVPAYRAAGGEPALMRYQHLFVGLDCSARAEYVLPFAVGLAQFHKAVLILGMVIRAPEMVHRLPPSAEDLDLVNRISERNRELGEHYLEQLREQISMQGVELETRLVLRENVTSTLHDMVAQEHADLVMLVAHGRSGDDRWPYGSIATSFITYGNTPLIVMQDLSREQIKRTVAEMAVRETKGH
jgi:nucleotide-binding universal stress UspA family protein